MLFLVLYLCILLLEVNKGLFLTVNKISEKMYWEYNVIICIFLKASLQDSLTLELVMYSCTPEDGHIDA